MLFFLINGVLKRHYWGGDIIERIALSTKEVSAATGIPIKQIALLREAGLIKGRKIGKSYFYSVESIKKFIEEKR